MKDPELQEIRDFLEKEELPADSKRARKVALQSPLFVIEDQVLYYLDQRQKRLKRTVVPSHLKEPILWENHSNRMGGHISGRRMYGALIGRWWWDGMYADSLRYAHNCPVCANVSGGGRIERPSLHPIPVQRPIQIVGVMSVFQDYLTKKPFV